jgi:hypothetical protein
MGTTRRGLLFGGAVVGILLAVSATYSGGQAGDAKKLEERVRQLEQRLSQTERHLGEILKAFKELPAPAKEKPARWQMLNAGKKVVILDTEMGQFRTVEPEATTRVEAIKVGNTLFIVHPERGIIQDRVGSK